MTALETQNVRFLPARLAKSPQQARPAVWREEREGAKLPPPRPSPFISLWFKPDMLRVAFTPSPPRGSDDPYLTFGKNECPTSRIFR
jgi:hypothetical protein